MVYKRYKNGCLRETKSRADSRFLYSFYFSVFIISLLFYLTALLCYCLSVSVYSEIRIQFGVSILIGRPFIIRRPLS